jgi:hypothetical protein
VSGVTPGRVQVTFDCEDPTVLAGFWAAVLSYPAPDVDGQRAKMRAMGIAEEDLGNWCRIEDPSRKGLQLFFQKVPEPKTVKNRMHLDVAAPSDGPGSRRQQIDAEVDRLVALGARVVGPVTDEAGYFVVMHDPEGNEFCID